MAYCLQLDGGRSLILNAFKLKGTNSVPRREDYGMTGQAVLFKWGSNLEGGEIIK